MMTHKFILPLDTCLKDIQLWMAENKLKFNLDMTELIIFAFKKQQSSLKKFFPVDILGNQLKPTKSEILELSWIQSLS